MKKSLITLATTGAFNSASANTNAQAPMIGDNMKWPPKLSILGFRLIITLEKQNINGSLPYDNRMSLWKL